MDRKVKAQKMRHMPHRHHDHDNRRQRNNEIHTACPGFSPGSGMTTEYGTNWQELSGIKNGSSFCFAKCRKVKVSMAFFGSAITILQTLVTAIGAGLGVWGVINLLEGYGNDNRATRSRVNA